MCRCPELQKSFLENKLDQGQAYKASISAFLNDQVHFEYTDVPFCLYPTLDAWIDNLNVRNDFQLDYKPINFAACTQVRAGWHDESTIEWIIYHMNQGFRHFYIYPDGESAHWRCLLKPLIDLGVVEIVEWHWQELGFIHQQAQQNSCIYRYRGTATWVAPHDVDEFLQPMHNNLNLADTIAQFPLDIGALQVRSIYFGSNEEADTGEPLEKENTSNVASDDIMLLTETYVHRDAEALEDAHQKCLVRPENVLTFSVHLVTSGNTMIAPDPNILRLAHYKPTFNFTTLDETMKSYSTDIKSRIKSFYPNGLPAC